MGVIARECERGVSVAIQFGCPTIRLVVVARTDVSGGVDELMDASEMIIRVEEIVCALLFTKREEALCGCGAGGVALLAEFIAAPEESGVGRDNAIVFFNDADATAESVVSEFAAMRTVVDGRET